MRLLERFEYREPVPGGTRVWEAPAGSVIDGASIPSSFWMVVGPPFVGDYRRASVLHDVACQRKDRPHDQTHLAFYSAMRADGVPFVKANVMYQAVKRFGPRWGPSHLATVTAPMPDDVSLLVEAVQAAVAELSLDASPEAIDAYVTRQLSI